VAVKIKLMRLGKIREPYYRIVVADARTRRDGRAIETIGKYHPKRDPSLIEVDSDRAQYWLGVGAQPTHPVRKLLEITGDWQRFKGLPGAEGTLRQPDPPVDRLARFQAALAAAGDEPTTEATTAKKRSERKPRKPADGGAAAETAEAPAGAEPAAAAAAPAESAEPAADAAADRPGGPAANPPDDAADDAGSDSAATDASSTS
jgi:small subunit ribosomal protein S16